MRRPLTLSSRSAAQVASLSSRLEQEIHRRNLSQSELKMQNQQVSVMRSSEKALKQEINHLLDLKDGMESQNQELRRFEQMRFNEPKTKKKQSSCQNCLMGFERAELWLLRGGRKPAAAEIDRLLVPFQGQSRYGCPAEGAQGPAGG